jgi:hypothetical protein
MATIGKSAESVASADTILDRMAIITEPASAVGSVRVLTGGEVDRVGCSIHSDGSEPKGIVAEVGAVGRGAISCEQGMRYQEDHIAYQSVD